MRLIEYNLIIQYTYVFMRYPVIDPVAFNIGFFEIKWYSIAYLISFIIGLGYFSIMKINRNIREDILFFSVLGIIMGGRIGYIIFYNFNYYSSHLLEIFKIWNGGMSFHGGFLGYVLALNYVAKKHRISFLYLCDISACFAPIGIFLGRIANFINGELYGRTTSFSLGMVFPNSDGLMRHPSQLYEAFGEGLIIFLIINYLALFSNYLEKRGKLSALFVILYSLIRITLEQFREPDAQIGFVIFDFTMGQILSATMILIGVILLIYINSNRNYNKKKVYL